jgi:DNA modification methylase
VFTNQNIPITWITQKFNLAEIPAINPNNTIISGHQHLHPTQKPVRLSERALKRNSQSGDIVIDAFGGSGSTLIACEQLDRKAYLMELDPKFCDVIIKRCEAYTGKKAFKDDKATR